jgi:hypothetical protein
MDKREALERLGFEILLANSGIIVARECDAGAD